MPKVVLTYVNMPVDTHPMAKKILTESVKLFFEELGFEVEQCHLT